MIESLTSQEKVVLRQVVPGVRLKTIGANLGISTETVRVHLRHAREKLRVSSSLDAARLLAEDEALGTQNGVTPPKVMACSSTQFDSDDATWGVRPMPSRDVVREAQASASYDLNYRSQDAPVSGAPSNELSSLQRLALIVAILVGLALAIIALPALHDSFQRVANAIEPPN